MKSYIEINDEINYKPVGFGLPKKAVVEGIILLDERQQANGDGQYLNRVNKELLALGWIILEIDVEGIRDSAKGWCYGEQVINQD